MNGTTIARVYAYLVRAAVIGVAVFSLVAIIAANSYLSSYSFSSESRLMEIQSGLESRADRIIGEMSVVCHELNLQILRPPVSPMTIALNPDQYMTPPVPFFDVEDRASYRFKFLQKDGSLTSFGNTDNYRRLFQVGALSYEKPVNPSWDKARAALVASKFLTVFQRELKIKLGEPFLRYEQHNTNNRYYAGQWNIFWPRVDSQGHAFEKDGVFMSLPEGFAPSAVLIAQSARFIERRGPPMAMDAALGYARRRISSEQWWDVFWSYFPQYQPCGTTEIKPTRVYLQIIEPEHKSARTSRLAWVFWFHHHYDHSHYPVSYWIDAYTGKYLGGDVVGLDTPD